MSRTTQKPADNRSEFIMPATSSEAEESLCIALATNLVKQRLANGTASSQEVCHFLKLGSQQSKLETEKLRRENELLKAKTDALNKGSEDNADYKEVLRVLKIYRGEAYADRRGEEEGRYERPY